jgi:hypothetical protein
MAAAAAAPNGPFGVGQVTGEAEPVAHMLRAGGCGPHGRVIQLGLDNLLEPHLTVTTNTIPPAFRVRWGDWGLTRVIRWLLLSG